MGRSIPILSRDPWVGGPETTNNYPGNTIDRRGILVGVITYVYGSFDVRASDQAVGDHYKGSRADQNNPFSEFNRSSIFSRPPL